MPDHYRAISNFTTRVGDQEVVLQEGEERVASDAVVQEHPELFEPSESGTPDAGDIADESATPDAEDHEGPHPDDQIVVEGETADDDRYDVMTSDQLQAEAKKRNITGRSTMSKTELQAALREADVDRE